MARRSRGGPVRNPFNGKRYASEDACVAAMERDFGDQLERLGVSAAQALFNVRNRYPVGQTHGRSVLSGKPTEWNEKARRYERFADDAEREQYRQAFLARMRSRYGKDHLLDDPEQQKAMLAGRRISGEYAFRDGHKKTYTGKEELALLQFLDTGLDWPGSDVQCPAPQVIRYVAPDGRERSYIPDAWIESLNLIIEVKGELHKGYRLRDIDVERAKDAVLGTSGYEYVKVEDGDYSDLLDKIAELRGGQEEVAARTAEPGSPIPVREAAELNHHGEPHDSTFRHAGSTYDLNRLLDAIRGRRSKPFMVSELRWVLEYDRPRKYRLKKADTSKPVLVVKWEGKLVVIDGLHRLAKADAVGQETIPGIEVTQKDLDRVRVLVGDARFQRAVKAILGPYEKKRDFGRTPEPTAASGTPGKAPIFVVQRHDASTLHFDFRLEVNGVLKSWAVPKGPSETDKRLAVQTEDHPLAYAEFEGEIPKGNYGAGSVEIWDRGTWAAEGDAQASLDRGKLAFQLHGERLKGRWALIHTGGKNWLLIKSTKDTVGEDADWDPATGFPLVEGATVTAREDRFHLPTATSAPPTGPEWFHELKYDGIRVEAEKSDGRVRLMTRGGLDWTERLQPVADAIAREVTARQATIDGEVAVPGASGMTDFQELQEAIASGDLSRVNFYAFDIKSLNGGDIRGLPFSERRNVLSTAFPNTGRVILSRELDGEGAALKSRVCSQRGEGVVSKRRDSKYVEGRNRLWLKAKCAGQQEFVVVGYTAPKGSREHLGALLLAYNDGGRLRYAGKAGTGYSRAVLAFLNGLLGPIVTGEMPLDRDPKEPNVTWVRPVLVAEVRFMGWTRDGMLRQPAFLGIRPDKDPSDVVREDLLTEAASVEVTNRDRVLFPESGMTKGDLADYYASVAQVMLPYVANRPLTIVRHPKGVQAPGFMQRNVTDGLPPEIKARRVGSINLMYVEDAAGLVALAQIGAVEIHTWGSRIDSVDRPDSITIDLDPGPDCTPADLVRAAEAARARMERDGLRPFLKHTGSTGLHVVAPIEGGPSWDEALAYARSVAEGMVGGDELFTIEHLGARRRAKVYVDFRRNSRASTSIAPFSTRATPDGTIAYPASWGELGTLKPVRADAAEAVRAREWRNYPRSARRLPAGDDPRPELPKAHR